MATAYELQRRTTILKVGSMQGLHPAPHPEGERVEGHLHNAYRAGNAAWFGQSPSLSGHYRLPEFHQLCILCIMLDRVHWRHAYLFKIFCSTKLLEEGNFVQVWNNVLYYVFFKFSYILITWKYIWARSKLSSVKRIQLFQEFSNLCLLLKNFNAPITLVAIITYQQFTKHQHDKAFPFEKKNICWLGMFLSMVASLSWSLVGPYLGCVSQKHRKPKLIVAPFVTMIMVLQSI